MDQLPVFEGSHNILLIFQEELEVDLEDSLQEAHVGPLVQANLMLPDVYNQYLAGGESEKCALPFEVLILAPFATVGSFDIHDQDVVGHGTPFILGHPYSLGGLPTF